MVFHQTNLLNVFHLSGRGCKKVPCRPSHRRRPVHREQRRLHEDPVGREDDQQPSSVRGQSVEPRGRLPRVPRRNVAEECDLSGKQG